MPDKPVNPYVRLRDEARQWVSKVLFPQRRTMFAWKPERGTYTLNDIVQRTIAARQIGWEVVVSVDADNETLRFTYRQLPPAPPSAIT